MKLRVDKRTVRWAENCLNDWAQRFPNTGMKTSWSPQVVSSGDWYWGKYCLTSLLMARSMSQKKDLRRFTAHRKVGGVVDTSHGYVAMQRHLNRLEKWVDLVKLNKGNCEVLPRGRNNPCTNIHWRPTVWKAALQKRTCRSWRWQDKH